MFCCDASVDDSVSSNLTSLNVLKGWHCAKTLLCKTITQVLFRIMTVFKLHFSKSSWRWGDEECLQKHQLRAALQNHTEEEETETEGRHPEADLGNLIVFNNPAGSYKIYKGSSPLYLLLLFFLLCFLTSSFYCTLSRSDFGEAVIQLIRVHTNWRTAQKTFKDRSLWENIV